MYIHSDRREHGSSAGVTIVADRKQQREQSLTISDADIVQTVRDVTERNQSLVVRIGYEMKILLSVQIEQTELQQVLLLIRCWIRCIVVVVVIIVRILVIDRTMLGL